MKKYLKSGLITFIAALIVVLLIQVAGTNGVEWGATFLLSALIAVVRGIIEGITSLTTRV